MDRVYDRRLIQADPRGNRETLAKRIARCFGCHGQHVADELHAARMLIHARRHGALPILENEAAFHDREVDRGRVLRRRRRRVDVHALAQPIAPQALSMRLAGAHPEYDEVPVEGLAGGIVAEGVSAEAGEIPAAGDQEKRRAVRTVDPHNRLIVPARARVRRTARYATPGRPQFGQGSELPRHVGHKAHAVGAIARLRADERRPRKAISTPAFTNVCLLMTCAPVWKERATPPAHQHGREVRMRIGNSNALLPMTPVA